MSELRGVRGCALLRPLFRRTVSFLGSRSLRSLRVNGARLGKGSLLIGITRAGPGRGRGTGLRARGSCVSVRVPLSNARVVNCATTRSYLPISTPCGTRGSVAFFRKLTRSCVTIGPKVFTVFFPRSKRTPNVAPSNMGGVVIGIGTWVCRVSGARPLCKGVRFGRR